MQIFRYISFEDFVRILMLKQDRLTRPTCWKDSYEGYLLRYLDNDKSMKKLVEAIYLDVCPRNYHATIENFFKLWYARWWTYGQCWTLRRESELMWRANSYGKHAIKIESTIKNVENIIKDFFDDKEFNITNRKVEYDLNDSADNNLKKQIDLLHVNLAVSEPYFHKTGAYESETEYRFVIQDNRHFQIEELSSNGALFNIYEAIEKCNNDTEILDEIYQRVLRFMCKWNETHTASDTLYYDIPEYELNQYIQNIVIHPDAEEWYVDLVKEICKKYNIACRGKSELYSCIYID